MKTERKETRKEKERDKERQRETETEERERERERETKEDTDKKYKKMPFLGGKTSFFSSKSKAKETKTKQKNKQKKTKNAKGRKFPCSPWLWFDALWGSSLLLQLLGKGSFSTKLSMVAELLSVQLCVHLGASDREKPRHHKKQRWQSWSPAQLPLGRYPSLPWSQDGPTAAYQHFVVSLLATQAWLHNQQQQQTWATTKAW